MLIRQIMRTKTLICQKRNQSSKTNDRSFKKSFPKEKKNKGELKTKEKEEFNQEKKKIKKNEKT